MIISAWDVPDELTITFEDIKLLSNLQLLIGSGHNTPSIGLSTIIIGTTKNFINM